MSALTWLPAGVTKEVRALLPAWAACTAAVAIGGLAGSPPLVGAAVLAYAVGAVALGAQSMGHEYSHGTLGLLLSQPSARHTLLLRKTGVLAAMLLALAAVAWTTLFNGLDPTHLPHGVRAWSLVLVVVPFALFVTPYLTMVCRNPLAAVVFAVLIPGVLLVGGEVLGVAKFGFHATADVDGFREAFAWRGILIVCVVAALASWFLFMRLEAVEGRGTEFHLPRWSRATAEGEQAETVQRSCVWLLVKKELRLQQMTLVLAGLYVLGWASLRILGRLVPEVGEVALLPLSVLYLGLLSVVIGSMASADERQFGTLEWQVLLPMASWQQWAVKAVTAFALALLLGAGMPLLLARIDPSPDELRLAGRVGADMVLTVMVLTSGGLYLSSFCTSGMRAVVLALPVIFGMLAFVFQAVWAISRALQFVPLESFVRNFRPDRLVTPGAFEGLVVLVAGGWVVLMLWLGLQNHRSSDRSKARLWRQAAWIAAYVVAAVTLFAVLEVLARAASLLPPV